MGLKACIMDQHELLREQAREKLRLAANASDPQAKQTLAAEAFQLAQEAEALERALPVGVPRAAK